MSTFQNFTSGGSSVLNQDIANPLQQSGFNQRIAMGNSQLFNSFAAQNKNLGNRAGAFGGSTPGFLQSQLNANSRSLSGMQNQNFNQNLLYADQLKQNAASQMLNYKPLQTGSTQTQSTGGVGSWLGPVASAAIGVATGGASTMMGAAGGASSGAFNLGSAGGPMADQSMNAYGNSMASNQNFIGQMGQNPGYSANNGWLN
jgi:hypothetical protein